MSSEPMARIVVVNDDTAFLSLMSALLAETEGYDVRTCHDGNNAYTFVNAQQPDLAILDLRMEGANVGWPILECLTLDPAARPIPVIVCSAAVRELQVHQPMLDRYGIDVLPRPFDRGALLAKIEEALSRQKRGRP